MAKHASTSGLIDGLSFLERSAQAPLPGLLVLFGDEPFLKREVRAKIRREVLGEGDGDFSYREFPGASAEMRDVLAELGARGLFGDGRKLVVVDAADDFVSENRPALEDYAGRATEESVLALDAKVFPATTRLYKIAAASGMVIECKTPPAGKIVTWLVGWARRRHDATLDRQAAEMALELVGPSMGLLDQELAKLACSVRAGESIGPEIVRELVGGWRVKSTWDMIDAALEGRAEDALRQLDRLLLAGEAALALFGQMAFSLRRLAAATRYASRASAEGRRVNLREALEYAGVKGFVVGKSETQLKRLGFEKGTRLYRWLLDADVALKGASSQPERARFVLEQMIARLASAPMSSRRMAAR